MSSEDEAVSKCKPFFNTRCLNHRGKAHDCLCHENRDRNWGELILGDVKHLASNVTQLMGITNKKVVGVGSWRAF